MNHSDEKQVLDIKTVLEGKFCNENPTEFLFKPTLCGDKEKKQILLFDINSDTQSLPVYLKSTIYFALKKANFSEVELLLIKDAFSSKIKDYNFKASVSLKISNITQPQNLLDYYPKEITTSKPAVKSTDLKSTFDPTNIAEKAVDLNLNLIKWRMQPDLDIEVMKKTKFLLIGAGTLGCHVSRTLLGWGARYITFLDNGKVSYSNPMRQTLYNFEDSKANLPKAEVAAKKIKEICPFVITEGMNFQIPLPGRTLINEKARESYFKNVNQLEDMIKSHDIIFLLTDSRESRWLPTLLSKVHNKECITAAIGFDSYLVIRHGLESNNRGKIRS